MQNEQQFMLDVWREACRHIRIDESTSAIADVLLRRMAVAKVLVRRIDVGRSMLETIAIGLVDAQHPMQGVRTEFPPDDFKRILTWCNAKHAIWPEQSPQAEGLLRLIVPQGVEGDLIAGPLGDANGPSGILLVATQAPRRFCEEDRCLLQALLEPFSVALENDCRLREIAALREAAEADRTRLLSKLGRQTLGDVIVGEESGLQSVMDRVERVARSDVPVLIFGETGTGKEVMARAIHTRSARSSGPFMRVNCGAIPAELIDSQLFGHERGSFTGATDTHRGWFERSDRGTLFLDEIGELPLAAQVRLLRVLQDGTFERVGGQHSMAVDVRIVAATHRDLSGMVREGRFREDLWYRLAVFPISLPPLRERPEDIPALARHFASRAATRFGLPPRMPTPEDISILVSYAWPGNVRELIAVMDRAAILGDGHRLEVAKALGVQTSQPTVRTESPVSAAPSAGPVMELDEAMRRHIETALSATRGRIEGPSGTAAMLNINPHTLRARMRKLGIDWKRFRS
jgi:transcriptional regulator with GAF, ATPase, and Fis domain